MRRPDAFTRRLWASEEADELRLLRLDAALDGAVDDAPPDLDALDPELPAVPADDPLPAYDDNDPHPF